jgi:dolichol kinase
MNPWLLIVASLALLVAVLAVVAQLTRRLGLDAEVARKTIHVSLGLYCLTFPLLFDRPWQVIVLCAAAFAVLLAARLRALRDGLGCGLLGIARQSHGDLLFAVAVALIFLLQQGEVVAYVLPLTILTLCDAAAALVGSRYGRNLFTIEAGRKSWEGAAMFLLTAWIISMALLLLLSDAPRLNVIVLGFAIAAYGTTIEAASWRGWDNLFVPLALNLLLTHHLHASPATLLIGLGVFLLTLLVVGRTGRRLGLDPHAGYFIATMLWTIAIASTAWNVVLPGAALICYALAQRRRPAEGFPHLQAALATIVVALFWYVLNAVSNLGTVYSFNVSFAAMGAALLTLCGTFGIWGSAAAALVLSAAVHVFALNGIGWTPTDARAVAATLVLVGGAGAVAVAARRWLAPDWPARLAAPAIAAGLLALPFAQP